MSRAATHAVAALATLALAGCSLHSPYSSASPPPTIATAPNAGDPPPERNGHIPSAAQAIQTALEPGTAQPTPEAALARYSQIAVNWNWRNLAAVQHHLASISLGQARAQALQAAAGASTDSNLRAQRITNTGQPISIAGGQGPAAGQWVIVTRERTTGQDAYAGLPPTLHITYAQTTHTRHGYVVSRWTPQN